MNLRQSALVISLSILLAPTAALAVQDFNEDVRINDPTPGLTFNDTDSVGSNWFIRGRDEYFAIVEVGTSQRDVLNINPEGDKIFLGYSTTADGAQSIALGSQASSTGNHSTAVGFRADADGSASVALGYTAESSGNNSSAIGMFANSEGSQSAAIGYAATTEGTALRSTALGHQALADQPDTIVLGAVPGLNFANDYANVGMGTNTPVQAVDVERSEAAARFQLTSLTNTANEAPQYIQRRARGTRTSPTAVVNNDNLGLFSFRGHNGSVMGGSRATITAQAAGNFTISSTPTRLIFATTPVGQTAPQQVLVITPDGKVQVNGQNLNVPDYVFEDDYELMPLDELRAFIESNGHLPGIAPAQQMNAEGLDLAGSQMGLLQKVEELTLYTLQQQAHIERLQSELEASRAERRVVMAMLSELTKKAP